MRMPSGVVKSDSTPGTFSTLRRIAAVELVERALAVGLEHDQHVGDRVRHRVLGALGAAGAAHHVFDLGERAQHVLDAVVQAVHLLERGLAGQHGLQQQRALVELGHEDRGRGARR